MQQESTVVVGAGLIGLATGLYLAERGLPVTVLEAAPCIASGASQANGGMITPGLSEPWNAPGNARRLVGALCGTDPAMRVSWSQLPRLLSWGQRFLRFGTLAHVERITHAGFRLAKLSTTELGRLQQTLKLESVLWPRGTIALYTDPRALESQLVLSQRLGSEGLRCEVLSATAVAAREPALAARAPSLAGGLWFADDQCADSAGLCAALSAALIERGGTLRLSAPVRSLYPLRDGIGLSLGGQDLEARQVILACGVQATHLLAPLRIRLPVVPARGHSLSFALDSLAKRPAVAVYDQAQHIVCTQLGGTLRVAGTAEFDGFNTTPRPAAIRRLARAARTLFAGLALDSDAARPWAGLRPVSADGLPYIGASGIPGLWLNVGHGALGLTQALGSAAVLTSLMTAGSSPIDPSPYEPAGRL